MLIRWTNHNDKKAWILLAEEVAPIFGNLNMAKDSEFLEYMEQKISQKNSLIAVDDKTEECMGVIGFSKHYNRITWFGVFDKHRNKGVGTKLLQAALNELDPLKDRTVETYREGYTLGEPARHIYHKLGFADFDNTLFDHFGNPRCKMVITPSKRDRVRTLIPSNNNVNVDYKSVLDGFITLLNHKQKNNIRSIFLTGSYARGDATDSSDLDVWCIFDMIDSNVLYDVGATVRELPVSYDQLEINSQCFSVKEFDNDTFASWSEKPIKVLDSVLLYGDNLVGDKTSVSEIEKLYKKQLADILLGIRHYMSVDEPVEKLTYKKIKTYILKPLMFSLRLERFCTSGYYPLSNEDLLISYNNSISVLIEYFLDQEKFDADISRDHRSVLSTMHRLVAELIK